QRLCLTAWAVDTSVATRHSSYFGHVGTLMTVRALCTPHPLCLGGIIKKHDGTRSSAAVQNHEQYLAVLKIDTASGRVHDHFNSPSVHTAADTILFSFAVEVYKL